MTASLTPLPRTAHDAALALDHDHDDRVATRDTGAASIAATRAWRIALAALLALAAALYTIALAGHGYGNSYYAAAAQAGAESWRAMLFASLDPSLGISVDKPPLATMLMSLSVRIFGMHDWSVMLPQAVCGVASVGLIAATVRRATRSSVAGIGAGLVLALTPVATMMFRYDHLDALLVLLLVGAAAAVQRGLANGRWRWVLLAGALVGLGFLTKMLQAALVLPAFASVWMLAAPGTVLRRAAQVLAAGAAFVVAAGWWLALVELWPAGSRPYVGGSGTANSALELALGYNGVQRISSGMGGPGGGFSGTAGIGRLFNSMMGSEISWLLPTTLICLAAGAVLRFNRGVTRRDPVLAALTMWAVWLGVTGGVFSLMSGTIHPYYTVALAPAIAAIVAIGGHEIWRARASLDGRVFGASAVVISGIWSWVLLGRASTWHPSLRWGILVSAVVAAACWLAPRTLTRRVPAALTIGATALALLLGPASWSVATASHGSSGPMANSGPATMTMGGMGGGMGGGEQANSELVKLLRSDTTSDWVAAVSGGQTAASLEVASGASVLGMGGWSGDPFPSLSQFHAYVAAGRIHYLIAGGGMGGGPGGGQSTSQIQQWVAANYSSTTVGGQTVYDLTSPA